MAGPPDTRSSLIARLVNISDHDAWREFAGLYEPFIYGQARRFGLQHADASDLVQDVLIAVSTAVQRFAVDDQRGRFRTWLYAVGRNVALQHLGKARTRESAAGDSDVRLLLSQVAAPDANESRELMMALRRHAFLWVAEHVRSEFQSSTWRAFWQTAVENHSVKNVAETLGMSVGAVYIARSRVMARLRERVQEITLDDLPEAMEILEQTFDADVGAVPTGNNRRTM